MVPRIELTKEQQDAVYSIVEGVRKKGLPTQTLGGYGGTGKTVVVSYLLQVLDRFAVAAYTGKATNVLRKKGAPASTIHSLIYKPFKNEDGSVTFHLKTRDEFEYEGILIDEASMVTEQIDEDLRSFGVPILYVGDHGQLPPVGNDFNIMGSPMYRLEKIHRNAGTIAKFCEWVRFGHIPKRFPVRDNRGNKVRFLKPWDVTPSLITQVDQIICAFNKTRVDLNNKARHALGFTEILHRGEKIMCLRNNRTLGIFNGMQGRVLDFYKEKKKFFLDFESYGVIYPHIPYDPGQFGQETTITEYAKDGPIPFDYADCVTCHKSIGDEWDTTMVFEQVCKGWEHRRWAYTAGSRVKELLFWVAA